MKQAGFMQANLAKDVIADYSSILPQIEAPAHLLLTIKA